MTAAQENIQLTVKTLTGDLFQFEIQPGTLVEQFKPMLYDACPDLPYGCAKLFRQDSERPLRNNEALTNTEEMLLFVDPDNVSMTILYDTLLIEMGDKDPILIIYSFYEKGNDTPFQVVNLICDLKRWADQRTFIQTRRTERGWVVRQFEPTAETVWYSSELECVQAINTQMNRPIQNLAALSDTTEPRWNLSKMRYQ